MPDPLWFKDHAGKAWDLNDPDTYTGSWFPHERFEAHTCDELRVTVQAEVGLALYYMLCVHPTVPWGDQRERVVKLGSVFEQEFRDHVHERMWLLGKLFVILDETENMC